VRHQRRVSHIGTGTSTDHCGCVEVRSRGPRITERDVPNTLIHHRVAHRRPGPHHAHSRDGGHQSCPHTGAPSHLTLHCGTTTFMLPPMELYSCGRRRRVPRKSPQYAPRVPSPCEIGTAGIAVTTVRKARPVQPCFRRVGGRCSWPDGVSSPARQATYNGGAAIPESFRDRGAADCGVPQSLGPPAT